MFERMLANKPTSRLDYYSGRLGWPWEVSSNTTNYDCSNFIDSYPLPKV